MFTLFTKKGFKLWLIIGVGMFGVILLLQYHRGRKQPIANTDTVQTPLEAQRGWVKSPSTTPPTIKPQQQEAQTGPNQSDKLESIPTATGVPDTATPLDKEETIHSLVNSLSDEDIEVLEGLTLKDFLSDEELKKLDRKIAKSLREFVDLVPKIVEHRAKLGEIMVYTNNLAKQINQSEDKGTHEVLAKNEEITKNLELIKEMLDELATLRSRASNLQSLLLDSDFDSIGTQRDKKWIQQFGEDIWNNKGWPPELLSHEEQ